MNSEKKARGFAAMDPNKVKLIASLGGKAAHAAGTAHKFQVGAEEARAAGRKGGVAPHVSRGRVGPQVIPLRPPVEEAPAPAATTAAVAE